MVIGITGKMGQGKSSFLSTLYKDYQASGKYIWSNIHLKNVKGFIVRRRFLSFLTFYLGLSLGRAMFPYSNYRYFQEKEAIKDLPKGSLLLLDEAHLYYDSKAKQFLSLRERKQITDS